MSSGENLTINDSPIINSPLTSSPILSAPLTSSPSNVRYSSGLYRDGVKYEWGKVTPPYDGLCFTANTAGSTVRLVRNGSAPSINIETSTDGVNFTPVALNTTFTLTNVGDKIYIRNRSETVQQISTSTSNYYGFVMTGSISASGDVTYLLCKNGTDTLPDYGLIKLFYNCISLTTSPKLPATTLAQYCYREMFSGCSNLETLPQLSATTLVSGCYRAMFYGCTKIKLSTTQTGEYQTPYRIPTTGNGTATVTTWNTDMFANTGGTLTSNPSLNITYYVHRDNTIVG